MLFVNSTLFTMFFVHHDLKQNEIRCIDAPKYVFKHRNVPESEKYTWIIQNVHEKSRFFCISEYRATRHSAVSAFTETVEFLERSLASMLMIYCCSMIGCFLCGFFASCLQINVFYLTNLDKLSFFLIIKHFPYK